MTNAKMTAEQRKDLVQFRIATKVLKSKVQDILDDLEAAESRCRALEEVVRELVDRHCGGCEGYEHWKKALAVLSEGATGE